MEKLQITIGQRICTSEGTLGTVVQIHEPTRFSQTSYDVVLDDGTLRPRIDGYYFDGLQPRAWSLLFEVYSPEQILLALKYAERVKQMKEIEKARQADLYQKEKDRLKAELTHLTLVDGSGKPSRVIAAKNIRIELKRTFPKTKFSVTSDSFSMGDSIDVRWVDGPTAKEVEKIINKYEAGSFDGMTDSYTYINSPFTDLFGDAKYVHARRDTSPEAIQKAIDIVYSKYDDLDNHKPTAQDFKMGKTWNVRPARCLDRDYQQLIHMQLQEMTF